MSKHKILITLFVLAIVARLLFISFLVWRDARNDSIGVMSADGPTYIKTAQNILDHGVFSMSNDTNPAPDNYRTPGYIFFLLPFLFFHIPLVVVSVTQGIIASIAIMLFYLVARKIFDEHIAWIAALIFALEPFTVRASVVITATAFFNSFFFFVPLLLIWYIKTNNRNMLWGAAALLGWCTLIKPVAFVFFPFLFLAALWNKRSMSTLRNGSVAFVIFLVIISPWIIRNVSVLGSWEVSSVTHYVIYDVNAQMLARFYQLSPPTTSALLNVGYTNNYLSQQNLGQLEHDGISYIMKNLGRYAIFHLAFIPRLFIQDQYLDIFQKEGSTISLPPGLDLYSSIARFDVKETVTQLVAFSHQSSFYLYIIGKLIWVSIFALLIGIVWVCWKTSDRYAKRAFLFLMLFLFTYGFVISPVSRAGHRVPVNSIIFLIATSTLFYVLKKPIIHHEA